MALPDPELELLRELLAEDPGADVYTQVARELISRSEWEEAVAILLRGLEASGEEGGLGHRLLAEAAFKAGQFLRALSALERVPCDPVDHEDMARLNAMALEATGRVDDAHAAAVAFLEHHPDDVVVMAVLERLTAPPPDHRKRAADPLVSVRRAEEYAAVGRPDRAVRVYRRLHYHEPDDLSLAHRVNELSGEQVDQADDLSEEMSLEQLLENPPPGLTMPSPGAGIAPDSDVSGVDEFLPRGHSADRDESDPDSEQTDPAVEFDVEEIRRQIEERKRHAIASGKSGQGLDHEDEETEPFIYGEGGALDPDEEPTVMLPGSAADETPEQIEQRIKAAREKKRRSLINR